MRGLTMRILLQFSLAAALFSSAAFADEWSKHFPITSRADLRVDTNDGAVTVRTWDRKEIEARVTTAGWRIRPDEVQVVDRQTGDRIELEVKRSRPHFAVDFGVRSIRIELQVPRDLRTDIRTGDGSVMVLGVHGETRVSTGDGRIEAHSLDGTLDARTGDGRIQVQGRFDLMNLHTGDGSIDAEASAGSKMSSEWSVRTGDGHVTLRLPVDFSAELDVRTDDGHIKSDLRVTPSTGSRGDHELRGKLNAGGPPLIIRTNDGSINLDRL
jgi:hypothetical protein